MSVEAGERLSFREAARLIYRVQTPTPEQIERVRQHIFHRELAGDSRGTTTVDVADFLARNSALRQRSARRDAPGASHMPGELDRVYHESLKNFFLAVIFRRKYEGTSVRFQRTVVAGQITLLCAFFVAVALSARTAFPPLAPEQAIVMAWLEANAQNSRVIACDEPTLDEQGRTRMRVEYHYTTPLGKGVDTVRYFVISEGQVVSVDSQ